jgi:CTP:molybdopterin cytidylyltransferase MocA
MSDRQAEGTMTAPSVAHAAAGWGAVVVAAGTGARLGLGPKAHVVAGGRSLLEWIVLACRTAQVREVVVIGRPDDPRIEPACRRLDVDLRLNPAPERGMASSVRLGLDAASKWGGAVIWPVDVPAVPAATVQDLVHACPASRWARPMAQETAGHPIAIGSDLIALLRSSDERLSLREALAQTGIAPIDVPTAAWGVLLNVNGPAELRELEEFLGDGG